MQRYNGTSTMNTALADYLKSRETGPLSASTADILGQLRLAAATQFAEMAWPTAKMEEWYRTRVAELGLDELSYSLPVVVAPLQDAQKAAAVAPSIPAWLTLPAGPYDEGGALPADAGSLAALADIGKGQACPAWIKPDAAKAGLAIFDLVNGRNIHTGEALSEALEAKVLSLLAKVLAKADNKFIPWNVALAAPALLVHVPAGFESKDPVVIDWNLEAGEALSSPLLVLIAEKSSKVVVLQRLSGAADGLVNHLVVADVAPNAELESHVVQNLDESTVYIAHESATIARDARFLQVAAQLGSGLTKARVVADLNEAGSTAWLDGIYFGRDARHLDIRSVQNHNAPNAWSRAFYKGVVRDEARTVYQGMIYVAPHAPKTDAYMTNKNMVLNEGARADSIPCLNILTDDVKCSHGSTTGKLPEDQVFYLQTRGFTRDNARAALVSSYLGEILDRLPSVAHDYVRNLAEQAVLAGMEG